MALATMHDLMIAELRDLFSAETQLVMALPKMATGAVTPSLRKAFVHHLDETHEHVWRLVQIFELLEQSPRGASCSGMAGLLAEAAAMREQDGNDSVRDAGLLAVAQRIEHYQIAAYRTSLAFATLLAYRDTATLLEATLKEERAADELLNEIAENEVNANASESDEASDELLREWAAPRRRSPALSGR